MAIHAARLENSPRLQRVLDVLKDGRPHTTREVQILANVCNAHTAAAELRANGFNVVCIQAGRGLYYYRLIKQCERCRRDGAQLIKVEHYRNVFLCDDCAFGLGLAMSLAMGAAGQAVDEAALKKLADRIMAGGTTEEITEIKEPCNGGL